MEWSGKYFGAPRSRVVGSGGDGVQRSIAEMEIMRFETPELLCRNVERSKRETAGLFQKEKLRDGHANRERARVWYSYERS